MSRFKLGWIVAGITAIVTVTSAGTGLPIAPAAALTLPSTPPLDPVIAAQIKADGTKPMRAFVHADTITNAVSASRAARLRVIDHFDTVGIAVVEGRAAALPAALRGRGVSRIEADAPIRFMTDTSQKATRGREARTVFQPDTFADTIDGSGINIAVIDSGVDGTHPMFQRPNGTSKVVKNLKLACHTAAGNDDGSCGPDHETNWVDMSATNDSDSPSNGGHGTHVASIAAGSDYQISEDRKLGGSAPGADIVALSVGQTLSVYGGAAGMAWVLDHHADPCGAAACPAIRVVNNSWGPVVVGATYNADDTVAKIQDQLVAAGVTVVWAAGNGDATNDGGDGSDIRTKANGQSPTPGIISVANYSDGDTGTRDGSLDTSSSRGQQGQKATYPDLSAPGGSITAACRAQLPVCFAEPGTEYGTIGGTSMAAPHVAGIVAQLLQVDPTLTPGQIEDILEDTAYKFRFGAAYEDDLATRNDDDTTSFDKGHGLVDATSAIARVLGVPAPPVEILPGEDPFAHCEADGPVLTDPTGDATYFASADGLPNEPGLDITELRLADNAADVIFTFTLDDLSETPATLSLSNSIEVGFGYNGKTYEVSVYWAEGAAPRASFGETDATLGYTEIGTPTPALDYVNDTITVSLAKTAFTPLLQNGSSLTDFLVRTRYNESPTPIAPVADDTTGTAWCPYTVGYGAIPAPPGSEPPPPPPPAPPVPDFTLSRGGAANWRGVKTTGSDTLIAGEVTVTGLVHDLKRVALSLAPGEKGTLTVSVKNDFKSYLLLEIRDKDGNRLAYTEGLPTEKVRLIVPNLGAGEYIVDVGYFVGVQAIYHATASLK